MCVCVCMSASDVALKEYLLHLEQTGKIPRVIIEVLDDTHLFLSAEPGIAETLQREIDAWHDLNSYQHVDSVAPAVLSVPASNYPKRARQ